MADLCWNSRVCSCRPIATRDFSWSARHAVCTKCEVWNWTSWGSSGFCWRGGLLWIVMEMSLWMTRPKTDLSTTQMIRETPHSLMEPEFERGNTAPKTRPRSSEELLNDGPICPPSPCWCKNNTSKDPFSRCAICKNYGYSLSWRWQDKVGLQHQEENLELRMRGETERWDVRHQWQRENQDQHKARETRHLMWWTRECARSLLVSSCSVCVVILTPATHCVAQDVRVFVSSHPCTKWAFTLSTLSSPFHAISSSHSSSIWSSSCCPSTSTRLSSKIPCATSPRRWGQLTSPSPTQVMSPRTTSSRRLKSSPSQSPWPSNGSPSNGSSRMWITMTPRSRRCSTALREHVYHSQREGLSVGQSSSSVSKRSGRPVVENSFGPTRGSKSSPTVRRRLRDTNSRLIMTEEENKN